MANLSLIIGNKRYSSWSLRPWIALKQIGLPFREVLVVLRRPDTKAEILKHSPSGKIPCLIDGELSVWDSLAILEYLNELKPEARLWPNDRAARAVARAIAAEMHSGFTALRQHLGMDLKREPQPGTWPAEAAADIERVQAIWAEMPNPLRRRRTVLVRPFHCRRRHVRAGGDPIPPLRRATRSGADRVPRRRAGASGNAGLDGRRAEGVSGT